MINDKKNMDNFNNNNLYNQKTNLKKDKNKLNFKKIKEPELVLSRIEEFIFKDRFIDTCVLKDLNTLFNNNNNNDKNKDNIDNMNHNIIGFTIDTYNHTLFKFNKSPNKLEIERFVLPDKKQKKMNKINECQNESMEKINFNNISENKGQLNFIKKFNDNYQSELEECKKKHKQVNSNIIKNSKLLKKKLKEQKNVNTLFSNMNVNDILNESKINKKKMKSVKNKDNKSKFMEKDIEKAEKYNTKRILKEKDNYKEDNNNYINNIKAKKHNDIFQFNKHKILLKKGSSNFPEYHKDIFKNEKNDEDCSNLIDNNKKVKKNLLKTSNNNLGMKRRTKSCHFKLDRKTKLRKTTKNKFIKFRSDIYSRKCNNPFKNKLLTKKYSENNVNFKKKIQDLTSDNSIDKTRNFIFSDSNIIKFTKERKKKNSNILNFESDKFIPNNLNNDNNSTNIVIKNEEDSKRLKSLKDNNDSSYFKVKHINNIQLESKLSHKDEYNNNVIKISSYSVVKPDNLISLEYNKIPEDNKNNIDNNDKRKKLAIKNSEVLNEENNAEALTQKNENNIYNTYNDNINSSNIERKHCKFFCCL